MAETEQAGLDGLIVPTEVREVLATSGWRGRKVHPPGNEADVLYVFKAKLGWQLTRELFATGDAAKPLITVRSPRRGLLGCLAQRPVTLALGEGGELLLEPAGGRLSLARRFAWQGRAYEWRLASPCFSAQARLVLELCVGGDARQTVADFASSSWTRRGTLTVRQGEHGLPRKLLVATALTMEALLHSRSRARYGHGYTGG